MKPHLLFLAVNKDTTYEEAHVLQQLAQGSEIAFAQILDRYQGRVYGTAYEFLKSREHAKEIVQDVFLKVWLKRATFTGVRNLEAFIVTIAKNLTINYIEKLAHERVANYEFQILRGKAENTTDHRVRAIQAQALLNKTIERLPPQQQLVFRMSRIEGLSHDDIAKRLNISAWTVNYHINSALKFLRNHIEPHMTLAALPLLFHFLPK